MKVKVSETSGPALDWMVAKARGLKTVYTRHWVVPSHPEDRKRVWRYKQSEQGIRAMDGYEPGPGWTPLYE